ncbi:hypothetical protein BKK79_34135 [Cupriavidus sp. USMAA2-4]|uniref:Uncharacterized protein n=1 Tax=Cupriavidus malaysiensis TaxID=367825 RepID=A0ABN4TQK2_9BURK|nr:MULTISPECIES: hypothetical protein [Cupriavidus]AOY96572.1 hypothetical protein BKK79_34135 [Cupriavidus sp. USMAA2-4]AOZ03024.1 hypothetical protein BKK81_28155 [Cupriavidus sp. USMAHM13]AOZ09612.1 hypothetical protein BKK80_28220 [Cupriavidus malaysiensis]
MQQTQSSSPCPIADTSSSTPGKTACTTGTEFPPAGDQLVHILHITSVPDHRVVDDVSGRMTACGGTVDGWRVVRSGPLLAQEVRLRGVSQACARAVREELLALDEVLRIRLEHLYLRRGRPA